MRSVHRLFANRGCNAVGPEEIVVTVK